MIKSFFTRDRVVIILLLLGIVPACNSWPWAKVTILLWCMIALLFFCQRNVFIKRLYSIVLSVGCSATLWALLYSFMTPAPWLVLVFTWAVICIFGIQYSRTISKNIFILPPYWLSKSFAGAAAIAACAIFIAVHAVLNYHLHKPFHIQEWTSVTWMLFAFLLFYPEQIEEPFVLLRKNNVLLLLLLCPVILHIQHCCYTYFEDELYKRPAEISQKAFAHGFPDLGVKSVLYEAARLSQTNWPEAVKTLRSAWRYENKFSFAKEFRRNPQLRNNEFLFTVTWGCDLQLLTDVPIGDAKPLAETAVSILSRAVKQEIYVLTGARLLRINTKGVSTFWNFGRTPIALAGAANLDHIGVLMDWNQVLVYSIASSYPILYLPGGMARKDIQLSADGETVYVMSGDGGIEIYRFSREKKIWESQKTLSASLWSNPDIARKILLVPEENGVFMLDRSGGVVWCGDQKEYKNYSSEICSRYYNPLAPEMNTLAFWGNQILLGNLFGRIHFLNPGAEKYPSPVRADMYFDTGKSKWDYRSRAVSIAPVPQIQTILQCYENGSINAVVMPQRYRIEHKGKAFRIKT